MREKKRSQRMLRGVMCFAGAVVMALAPAAAMAQEATSAPVDAWAAWNGCWKLINGLDDRGIGSADGERLVCLEPGPEPRTAIVTTLIDGELADTRTIYGDGTARPVDDGSCTGSERTLFSADRQRLFNLASLQCEDGMAREASGISLLATPNRWVDVQVIDAAGEREVLVRRYRRVADETGRSVTRFGLDSYAMATAGSQSTAASPFDVDDVIEAVAMVDAAAVEAALIETNAGFDMDSSLLMRLAEADVPEPVIDVMVALSFPDYFLVDGEENTEEGRRRRSGYYPVYGYGYWSPAFAPFGFGSYYGYGYGYGYGNGYGYYSQFSPGRNIGRHGGRVIAGRGYARVGLSSRAPDGFRNAFGGRGRRSGGSMGSGGRSGGSKGSVSPGGRSSGRSGRTAKPRVQ